ncbi:hypothetical protein CPT_Mana_058 [Burkholderia phage Mana]|uniref:Uncharacterized protein n=1 Tax=Burkholderia phage Mana TaxID=2767578 RepID=A0A873WGJ6_9CAUD|nr:hypothetical protein KNV21_gp58 [Burkholderia phage Mana]QPB09453.1 hypothetical protein CPT_Mana_058 [Burkholderia phage Mana]
MTRRASRCRHHMVFDSSAALTEIGSILINVAGSQLDV